MGVTIEGQNEREVHNLEVAVLKIVSKVEEMKVELKLVSRINLFNVTHHCQEVAPIEWVQIGNWESPSSSHREGLLVGCSEAG